MVLRCVWLAAFLVVSVNGRAVMPSIDYCARIILITGRYWPCAMVTRSTVPATSTSTVPSTTHSTTSTIPSTLPTTTLPSSTSSPPSMQRLTATPDLPTTTSTTMFPIAPNMTAIREISSSFRPPTFPPRPRTTSPQPTKSTPSRRMTTTSAKTFPTLYPSTFAPIDPITTTTAIIGKFKPKKPSSKTEKSSSSESSEGRGDKEDYEEGPNVEVEERPDSSQNPLFPTPPPYFVTLLTHDSRNQFYRIAKNPFLTKSELLYQIRRWASRQPKQVREAIFDIESELVRHQMQVKKEAAAILEALPLAFLQYTNIRDNAALTKGEEREDLEALFRAMPHKTAATLRFVLMIAGSNEYSRREGERDHFLRTSIFDALAYDAISAPQLAPTPTTL